MLKIFLTLFFAFVCVTKCTIIRDQTYIQKNDFGYLNNKFGVNQEVISTNEKAARLASHVMDFLKLVDVQKMTLVAMQYMDDPEVLTFMKFLFSPQFKDLIWDFETMEEFKEAFEFLTYKGYDVESILNFVNTVLNLPAFEKPIYVLRNKKGISGFFEALINTLPLEDMKELFESKLETSPEVAALFETINSQEFMDIMKRMRENPKFMEFKMIFEGYGFDFKFLCKWAKEIFGDYYQGVFCE